MGHQLRYESELSRRYLASAHVGVRTEGMPARELASEAIRAFSSTRQDAWRDEGRRDDGGPSVTTSAYVAARNEERLVRRTRPNSS
jgi:hypothetical protein